MTPAQVATVLGTAASIKRVFNDGRICDPVGQRNICTMPYAEIKVGDDMTEHDGSARLLRRTIIGRVVFLRHATSESALRIELLNAFAARSADQMHLQLEATQERGRLCVMPISVTGFASVVKS